MLISYGYMTPTHYNSGSKNQDAVAGARLCLCDTLTTPMQYLSWCVMKQFTPHMMDIIVHYVMALYVCECHDVTNHAPLFCLTKRLSRLTTKKTSELQFTGALGGKPPNGRRCYATFQAIRPCRRLSLYKIMKVVLFFIALYMNSVC